MKTIDGDLLERAMMEMGSSEVGLDADYRPEICDDCAMVFMDLINKANTLTLNTMRDAIYQDAVEHGLFEDFDKITDPVRKRRALAMRIMEEAAEMYAAADDPEHYAEEAADVTIMTGDVCGYLGIDWHGYVMGKIAFNKTRPWKHGKEEYP